MRFKKYLLKDGSIYWHKLYYDIVPSWMAKYSPPLGSYNYAYFLVHPHKYAEDLYDEAKYFIQRGRRGYSDRDVWSVDWFLTSIMPGMLRQLKKTTHGAPIGLGMKRWHRKLDKMAETFEIARKVQDYHKDSRKLHTQFKHRMKDFAKYFFNLWD